MRLSSAAHVVAELDIGPVTLQTFGLLFATAFIAAGAVLAKRFVEIGKPADWAYEMCFAALIGGVVGARGLFVLENLDTASEDLFGTIFGGAGLTWYGGVIGGLLAVVAWARWRDFLELRLLDVAAVPLMVGYAVGRMGCQVSGDGDYGIEWGGPWAMSYPDGVVPIDEPVHPTPIYESVTIMVAAFVLWQLRDRLRVGALFALYLVVTGVERFLVEFIRRNEEVALSLTLAQLQSIPIAILGLVWLLWLSGRPGGLRPAPA